MSDSKILGKLRKVYPGASLGYHHGDVTLLGANPNRRDCLKVKETEYWKKYNMFLVKRTNHASVSTKKGLYVFGGIENCQSYEYLPKDSTTWLMGKNEIPISFRNGCAIYLHGNIYLIGNWSDQIIKFDVIQETFEVLTTKLTSKRMWTRCGIIPHSKKIIITGGHDFDGPVDYCEIYDTESGSVTFTKPMKKKRYDHALVTMPLNGKDKIIVFGGRAFSENPQNIEVLDVEKLEWNSIDLDVNNVKFGSVTLDLGKIF